ncbi:MAG: hypothetical protein AAF602_30330 [Myxococcota bacterium]
MMSTSLAMAALTVLLGSLATVVLLVLLVPIGFVARGHVDGPEVGARVAAWWGGGLVAVRTTPPEPLEVQLVGRTVARVPLTGASEPDTPKARRAKSGWRPGWRTVLRLVRRGIPSLGLRATVRGRLGTGDPADTAQLFLVLAALRRLVPSVDARGLTVDWLEPVARVEGAVEGRLWPVAVLWVVGHELWRESYPRRGSPHDQTHGRGE